MGMYDTEEKIGNYWSDKKKKSKEPAQTEGIQEQIPPITFESLEKLFTEQSAINNSSYALIHPSLRFELEKLMSKTGGHITSDLMKPPTLFGIKLIVANQLILRGLPEEMRKELEQGKIMFINGSSITVTDEPDAPLRGKSPLTSFYEKLPKCPHGHDKAWNAECPLCTPDDGCCKRDGDDYDCPLKFESYFDSAGNKILICSPDCCNRETVCEPIDTYHPGQICCIQLKKDKEDD